MIIDTAGIREFVEKYWFLIGIAILLPFAFAKISGIRLWQVEGCSWAVQTGEAASWSDPYTARTSGTDTMGGPGVGEVPKRCTLISSETLTTPWDICDDDKPESFINTYGYSNHLAKYCKEEREEELIEFMRKGNCTVTLNRIKPWGEETWKDVDKTYKGTVLARVGELSCKVGKVFAEDGDDVDVTVKFYFKKKDTDGDGIIDAEDKCPETPGTEEYNGCPPPKPKDTDGDGVPDAEDECPKTAGTAKYNGCPAPKPKPKPKPPAPKMPAWLPIAVLFIIIGAGAGLMYYFRGRIREMVR